mgnify:FL=1
MSMVLVGKKYWQGLINWLEDVMLVEGNINPEDLALFEIVDTAEEVVSYMLDYYRTRQLAPNF